MPNNQDAGKTIPLRGGFWLKEEEYYDGWTIMCGKRPVSTGCSLGPNTGKRFAAAMNAPTPREQEIEAQNKALWELVESCKTDLEQVCAEDISSSLCGQLNQTLAAIQQAKEGKV